jgi:photosystem II stability/assembly factor-like uncharacterized protein
VKGVSSVDSFLKIVAAGLGKLYLTRDGGRHWHFITP